MDSSGDLMAKFNFEGVDDLIAQYQKLSNKTEDVIGGAIYKGAKVVMKAVESAVDNISTDNRYGTADNPVSGPSSIQKAGLVHSLGITKMRNDNGFYNVKIGFDGYNKVQTKRWPQGQPNSMIARSIESGTSWMQKQPFMRKAEQSSRSACEKAMSEAVDKEIQKIIGE